MTLVLPTPAATFKAPNKIVEFCRQQPLGGRLLEQVIDDLHAVDQSARERLHHRVRLHVVDRDAERPDLARALQSLHSAQPPVALRQPALRARVLADVETGVQIGFVGAGPHDAAIGAVADAVVIGSALIQEIEKAPRDEAAARVTRFLAPIREALDNLSAVKA